MQALAGVHGVVGGSGETVGSGVEGIGGAAVNSLFALGKYIFVETGRYHRPVCRVSEQ
jgi:hypothetical protein